jgi:hypothetical protein
MQLITPIFLLLASIGIFFGYVDPHYKGIVEDKKIESQYDEALNRSRELQDIRQTLLDEYNEFDPEAIARLEKLLPDNIDNVRLIMEIDGVAKAHSLSVKNLSVSADAETASDDTVQIGPDGKEYSSMNLEFSIAASYSSFLNFMNDLEQSLRLVDVTAIDFKTADADFDEYRVTIKTYWLK